MDKPRGSFKPKITVAKRKVITDYYSTSRPSPERRRSASKSMNHSNPSPKMNIYGRGTKPLKFGRAAFQLKSNNVITNVYSKLINNGVMPLFVNLYTEKWHRERLQAVEEDTVSETSETSD